jgi:hypothetical protein
MYITKALELELEADGLPGSILWNEKCKTAIKAIVNNAGITLWKDKAGAPILERFAVFWKWCMFSSLLLESRYGPPFLVNNLLVVKRLCKFGDSNLENLKIDLMRDQILNHCPQHWLWLQKKRIPQ